MDGFGTNRGWVTGPRAGERLRLIRIRIGLGLRPLDHGLHGNGGLAGGGVHIEVLEENNAQLPAGIKSSDFSEIYLFFDYDFQNTNLTLDQMNERLQEMLEMFDDETDNGKLYVSYPMVESLCYTKQLPDEYFVEYTISRKDCMERSFKDMAREFIFYGSLDFIELPDSGHRRQGKKEIAGVRQNLIWLVQQHTSKANFMHEGVQRMPVDKEAVSQERIFDAQCRMYL